MQLQKTLLCTALAATLSACGGSGGGSDRSAESDNSGSGSSGDLVTGSASDLPDTLIGKISQVDEASIQVSGYSLGLSAARVFYQGEAIASSALVEGMPVIITKEDDQTLNIAIDPDIAGEVTALTENTISLGEVTLSQSGLNSAVGVGDYVFLVLEDAADGSDRVAVAAKAEAGSNPLWMEIEGYVANLDTSVSTFTVNGISVDYSGAVLEDGTFYEGQYVEVFGSLANGIFDATEVDIESIPGAGETEISGTISWVNEAGSVFELNGLYLYQIADSTRFEDGTEADIATGRSVEVSLVDSIVTHIEFEAQADDAGSSINADGVSPQFALAGTMTASGSVLNFNGFDFLLDAQTRYEDGLSINTLNGVAIEIEGVQRDSSYIVREVELMELDNALDLEGEVITGSLWGYGASDGSLNGMNGQWVDVDCQFDGTQISLCRLDD